MQEEDQIKKSLTDSFLDADLGNEPGDAPNFPRKKKKKVKKPKYSLVEEEVSDRLSQSLIEEIQESKSMMVEEISDTNSDFSTGSDSSLGSNSMGASPSHLYERSELVTNLIHLQLLL
jgi:hypothetical protein